MSRLQVFPLAVATAAVLTALLPTAAASDCLWYTTQASCDRYTYTGACRWDPATGSCLAGGKKLPPGAFGVAVVGLNPDTAPLVLKPGPSSSAGNVALGGGPPPVAKKAKVVGGGHGGDSDAGLDTPGAERTNAFCTLPAEPGRCRAAIRRWRWEPEAERCSEFVWGGCGGNANRFESREECEAAAAVACA